MSSIRRLSVCRIVLLVAAFIGLPPHSMAAVGRTPGVAAVSNIGAANYTIPIQLPPGTNNLAPNLSLVYDHNNGDSLLGMGFALSGLSAITRCNRTLAQDGVMQEPALAAGDAYCLDGQRLRLASGTYGTPGSTYRTEIDTFARVTWVGTAGGGPASWEVYQRDGLIFDYGATADSFIETVGSTTARVWAVNRIRDRAGNYIDFTYTEDTSNGAYRPNEISYTGHVQAAPATKVVFVYESANRPDPLYAYRYGTSTVDGKIHEFKRLDHIDIIHIPTATTIRTVDITYEAAGGAGNRSRIASIQECVAGDCLASTTFQWINGTPGWDAEGSTAQATFNPLILDINGDGHEDVAFSQSATPGNGFWHFMLGAEWGYFAASNSGIVNYNFADARVTNWNGDAFDDILVPCSDGVNWCVLQSTGTGLTTVATGAALNGAANLTLSVDINGDSREDLVRIITGSLPHKLGVRLRNATGFDAETIAWTAQDNNTRLAYTFDDEIAGRNESHLRRKDFNGDGREDFILRIRDNSGEPGVPDISFWRIFHGRGSTVTSGGSVGSGSRSGHPGDFNGDGLTDWIQLTSGCGVRFGRGLGLSAVVAGPACTTLPTVVDYDSDGLSDLLLNSGGTWMVSRSTGNGFTAFVSTGMAATTGELLRITDINGDGLQDLVRAETTTNAWKYRVHTGVRPDLLDRVTDGFGVYADFNYQPIASASACYVAQSSFPMPPAPARPYKGARNVVCSMSASDGIGGSYTVSHKYIGAYMDYSGRGFLGFRTKHTTDSRDNMLLIETFEQTFPYTGRLADSDLRKSSLGSEIRISQFDSFSDTIVYNGETRYFVYSRGSDETFFDVLYPAVGRLYTVKTDYTYDASSGAITSVTTAVDQDEDAHGSWDYDNVVHNRTISHPTLFNDFANWCIGRPAETAETREISFAAPAPITRTTSTTWDGVNCRPSQTVQEPGSTLYQVAAEFGYDSFGNIDSIVVKPAAGQGQADRITAIYWGTTGRFPETVTNALSQVTTFTWNQALGVRTGVIDPNSHDVITDYDVFGRVRRVTRPDDTATDYVLGWCTASTCPADANLRTSVTQIERDTANNEITSSYAFFDQFERATWTQSKVLSGALSTTRAMYNARGFVEQMSTPYLPTDPIWWTTTQYDLLGRPYSITRPKHEGDLSTQQTTISYQGLTTVITNGRNYSTRQVRNTAGRVVEVIDANNNTTRYTYDAFGNLLKTRDPSGNEIVLTYNNLGMKLTSVDPDLGSWSYAYYPLGELKTQTNAKSQTTTFTYDALSRLATRVEVEGTTTFGYDNGTNAIGKLTSTSSPGGYSESYTYDGAGRPSQTTIIADAVTYAYNYGYNPTTGLPETLTYPTSSSDFRFKLRYSYQNGMLQAINNYSSDVLGATYWQAQGMNARGQIVLEQYGNNLITSSGYDRITGWLDDRTTGPSASASIQNLGYLWDENGNLKQRSDSRTGVTETFEYDALDRMYQHNRNGVGAMTVGYDAIGNITSMTGVGTYTYHPTKKHAVTSTSGTLNNTYQYDANGNMSSRNGQTTTWYSYNLPNTINGGSGTSVQFMYGPNRERWKQIRTTSSGTGTTTYIGPFVERLVTASVNEFRHYVYGPTGPIAVYKRSSSGTSTSTAYLATDHLGSTDVITTTAGVQSVNMSFTPFGERKGADGVTPLTAAEETAFKNVTRRGFTFHEHLDEVQLIHMNGRVYDPAIGRFMSPDPFVTSPFNGQSFNRYSYVRNNPLSRIDPSGFEDAVSHRAYSFNLMGMTGEFRREGFSNRGERGDSLGITTPAPCNPGLDNPSCSPFPNRPPPSTGSPPAGGNGGTDVDTRPVLRQNPVAAMASDQITTASSGSNWQADLREGFMNAVPGAYYAGQSQLAWGRGEYGYSVLLYSAALADAAAGVLTFGESSLLTSSARTVTTTATREAGVDIALGLTKGESHLTEGMLQRFAEKVDAIHWKQWEDFGLGDMAAPFREYFMEAANKARAIKFNLTDMNLSGISHVGSASFEIGGTVTAAELMTILRNPSLLAKTTFFRDGKIISVEKVIAEVGK
jgi:RHS repeat-associated protein